MQMDISKLRSQLADTQRDVGDRQLLSENRLQKLEGAVFKQSADTNLEKEKLLTEVEQLKTQLQEIQTAKPVEPVPAPATEEPAAAPKNLNKTDQVAAIKTAYEDKQYERAIAGSETFLSKFADDKQFTAQILFWRGDSYYELGEYKKAVLSYQDLLTRFQGFSKVPEALYKVGVSLEALKFPKDASVFYEEVIKKHPKSSFALKAREQLKKKKK